MSSKGPLFNEYFNGENQVVSKSSAVPTANASDKRQQQPDSTSSTSTLATTASADGNFDSTFRVILFSFIVTNGNPSSVIIKQHCGRYNRQCCSLVPAKSDSLPYAHAQDFKVKHSAS
ncbi:hypothetical protein Tco_0867438 [Tanacetum coccineum]